MRSPTLETCAPKRKEKQKAIRIDIGKQINADEAALLDDCTALNDGIARLIIARDCVFARRNTLMKLAYSTGNDLKSYERILDPAATSHERASVSATAILNEGMESQIQFAVLDFNRKGFAR
jgi:hypothetical protein